MPPLRMGSVGDVTELASFYADPPDGVRANMIFSADGAAAFGGRAGSAPVRLITAIGGGVARCMSVSRTGP